MGVRRIQNLHPKEPCDDTGSSFRTNQMIAIDFPPRFGGLTTLFSIFSTDFPMDGLTP